MCNDLVDIQAMQSNINVKNIDHRRPRKITTSELARGASSQLLYISEQLELCNSKSKFNTTRLPHHPFSWAPVRASLGLGRLYADTALAASFKACEPSDLPQSTASRCAALSSFPLAGGWGVLACCDSSRFRFLSKASVPSVSFRLP